MKGGSRSAALASPVVRVLCRMHSQRRFTVHRESCADVLISSVDAASIVTWLRQCARCATSASGAQKRLTQSATGDDGDVVDRYLSRRATMAAALMRDLHVHSTSGSALHCASTTAMAGHATPMPTLSQFVCLQPSNTATPTAMHMNGSSIYPLPLTLSQLAQRVRLSQLAKTHAHRLDGSTSSSSLLRLTPSSVAVEALLTSREDPSTACAASLREATDCVRTLCRPRSKTLVLLDVSANPSLLNHGDDKDHVRLVRDGLTVATHLLRPDGAFVLLCDSARLFTPALERFVRWRFADVCLGVTAEHDAGFLFCRGSSLSAATAFGVVDRDDFPGLLPRGVRRERHWNPYLRSAARSRFFVSLRPRFTEAGVTGETLLADLARRGAAAAADEEAEAALSEVTHEMAATGAFDTIPSD